MDVKGIADRLGGEAELSGDIAVDDGGDERNRVMVVAEEGDAKEEMVEAVVVAVVLDASQPMFEKILGDDSGSLPRGMRVDIRMGNADGSHVRVESCGNLLL